MNEESQEYKKSIIKVITIIGIVLTLFLLVSTVGKLKEYRFIGSGLDAKNTITVQGKGKIERSPDTAKISFSVEDTKKVLADAQGVVSKKIETLSSTLKGLGIEEKYIKTDSYTSYPEYDYPQVICTQAGCPTRSPVLRGYRVSHSITVSVKDLEKVESVLGALGGAGVTNMSGPSFGFEDDKAIAREARELAIIDAKEEAQKLADQLGVKLVRIVSFSESGASPYPYYATGAMEMKSADAGAPVIPMGDETRESSVSIIYEIR
jgi:uncharacterized protein